MVDHINKMLKGMNNKILKQSLRMNRIAGHPGTAFKFGPGIKKLELVLLSKNVYKKSAGLKQFWQYNLPTLKFHNSDLDMVVTRIRPQKKEDYDKVPCAIYVHENSGNLRKLDCSSKQRASILKDLVALTSAQQVPESEIPHITVPNQ